MGTQIFSTLYSQLSTLSLFGLLVSRVFMAEATVFLELQLVRSRALVLCRRIISSLTLRTG